MQWLNNHLSLKKNIPITQQCLILELWTALISKLFAVIAFPVGFTSSLIWTTYLEKFSQSDVVDATSFGWVQMELPRTFSKQKEKDPFCFIFYVDQRKENCPDL